MWCLGSSIISILFLISLDFGPNGLVYGAEDNDRRELVLVQALWRHGDRSPAGTFPTDIYQEDHWPQGWGQLTPRGMKQHVELGKRLRRRYVDQLHHVSPTYNSHELYVRATDVNRTLISAVANFIGFYGKGRPGRDFPGDEPDWPTAYVPIAIHTVDGSEDFIGGNAPCARHNELRALLRRTPEYVRFVTQHRQLLEFLGAKTLLQKGKKELDLLELYRIRDPLFVERENNLTLVEWAQGNQTLLDQIEAANHASQRMEHGLGLAPLDGIDLSTELARIKGGTLLWTMLANMANRVVCQRKLYSPVLFDKLGFESLEAVRKAKSPLGSQLCDWIGRVKYLAYSAHDVTLASLSATLGFPKTNFDQDGYPYYASCVTVELWHDKRTGELSVNILYWKPESDTFVDITRHVQGCESGCTLSQFAKRSERYRMDPSPEQYCKQPLFPRPADNSTTLPDPEHGNDTKRMLFPASGLHVADVIGRDVTEKKIK